MKSRARGWLLCGLLLIIGISACGPAASEPPPLEEWAFELPSDVEVIGHPEVVEASRDGEPVRLEEDLVISDRIGETDPLFYRVGAVRVDADGRIYVADSGNHRIQVFDREGGHVRTLGRQGEGPGELSRFFTLHLAGDRLVAYDSSTRRLIRWSLDGEHLGDVRFEEMGNLWELHGLPGRELLAVRVEGLDDGVDPLEGRTELHRLERFRLDGNKVAEVLSLVPRGVWFRMQMGERAIATPLGAQAVYAVGPEGRVYAASVDEYRIVSLTPEGGPRWALWVPWPRALIDPEADFARYMKNLKDGMPDVSSFEWSERHPALAEIQVDGHGNLYVFPLSGDTEVLYTLPRDQQPDRRVDVYTPDGEHLYSGTMPYVRWLDTRGEFLFSSREDVSTGAVEVVRYRLVEPF